MSDPLALVYDFEADLSRFAGAMDDAAERVLRQAAQTAGDAITFGNQYGPGVPVDTRWALSSFAAGLNQPTANKVDRPDTVLGPSPVSKYLRTPTKVTSGRVLFTDPPDLTAIGRATLGDVIYITTAAEYPAYLEFTPKTRRFGPGKGYSTVFLEPVEQRFAQIVDDAAAHVGAV